MAERKVLHIIHSAELSLSINRNLSKTVMVKVKLNHDHVATKWIDLIEIVVRKAKKTKTLEVADVWSKLRGTTLIHIDHLKGLVCLMLAVCVIAIICSKKVKTEVGLVTCLTIVTYIS